MELTMAKMIVEWRCWKYYTVAVADTAESYKSGYANPDTGWHVAFSHN